MDRLPMMIGEGQESSSFVDTILVKSGHFLRYGYTAIPKLYVDYTNANI